LSSFNSLFEMPIVRQDPPDFPKRPFAFNSLFEMQDPGVWDSVMS
jgi:hypothetical protein